MKLANLEKLHYCWKKLHIKEGIINYIIRKVKPTQNCSRKQIKESPLEGEIRLSKNNAS